MTTPGPSAAAPERLPVTLPGLVTVLIAGLIVRTLLAMRSRHLFVAE